MLLVRWDLPRHLRSCHFCWAPVSKVGHAGETAKLGRTKKVVPTPPLSANYIQAVMGKLIGPQKP